MKKVPFKTILCLLGFLAFGFSCKSKRTTNDSRKNLTQKQQIISNDDCLEEGAMNLTQVSHDKLRISEEVQAEKFIYNNKDIFYLSASILGDVNNVDDDQIIANIMWQTSDEQGNVKKGLMTQVDPSDPMTRIAFVDSLGSGVFSFSFRACVWEGFIEDETRATFVSGKDVGSSLNLFCGDPSEKEIQVVAEQGGSGTSLNSAYDSYKKNRMAFEQSTRNAWQMIKSEVDRCLSKSSSKTNKCGYSDSYFNRLENMAMLTPDLYSSILAGPDGEALREASQISLANSQDQGAYGLAEAADECISTKDLEDAEQKIAQKEKKSPPPASSTPVVSGGGSMKPSPSPDANKEDSSSKAELTVQKKWEFYEQRKRLCRGYASGQEPLNWPWDDSQTCKDAGYEWLAKTDGSDQSFCYDIAISCTAGKRASLEGLGEGNCGDTECTASEDESSCPRDCDKDFDKIHVAFDCNDEDPNNKRDKTTDADCDGILKGNEAGYDCDDTNSDKGAREASDMDCNGVADSTGDNSTGNWEAGGALLAVGGVLAIGRGIVAADRSAAAMIRKTSLYPIDSSKLTLATDDAGRIFNFGVSTTNEAGKISLDVHGKIAAPAYTADFEFKRNRFDNGIDIESADGRTIATLGDDGKLVLSADADYDSLKKLSLAEFSVGGIDTELGGLTKSGGGSFNDFRGNLEFKGSISRSAGLTDLTKRQRALQAFNSKSKPSLSIETVETAKPIKGSAVDDIDTNPLRSLKEAPDAKAKFKTKRTITTKGMGKKVDVKTSMASADGFESKFFANLADKKMFKAGVVGLGVLAVGGIIAGFVCGFTDACGSSLAEGPEVDFARRFMGATGGDPFESLDRANACLVYMQKDLDGQAILDSERQSCFTQ